MHRCMRRCTGGKDHEMQCIALPGTAGVPPAVVGCGRDVRGPRIVDRMKQGRYFLGLALAAMAVAKQPNVVLILCDDLASQAVSAYGHPLKLLQTPNIDRLAREGI